MADATYVKALETAVNDAYHALDRAMTTGGTIPDFELVMDHYDSITKWYTDNETPLGIKVRGDHVDLRKDQPFGVLKSVMECSFAGGVAEGYLASLIGTSVRRRSVSPDFSVSGMIEREGEVSSVDIASLQEIGKSRAYDNDTHNVRNIFAGIRSLRG